MSVNAVNRLNAETGRATMGALIEAFVVIAIVPSIVCCALQAAVALVGIVLPWLALVVMTAALGACLAAAVTVRRLPLGGEHPLPPPGLPPIRRPPAIPDRRPLDRH